MSIQVQSLCKSFGQQKVLDNVHFELQPGSITGFLGPNGAGKTTTMRILTGQMAADAGKMTVLGEPVELDNEKQRQNIGYLAEHNPLYPDMYVREYLAFVAQMHQIPHPKSRIAEIIQMTGMLKESHKKIGQLSKGYKQRVGLAQAIIHDPPILILDEPTSGLDPHQLLEIRALIKALSTSKTVLLSTHILQEVEALCKEVIFIAEGKIQLQTSLQNLPKLQQDEHLTDVFVRLTQA